VLQPLLGCGTAEEYVVDDELGAGDYAREYWLHLRVSSGPTTWELDVVLRNEIWPHPERSSHLSVTSRHAEGSL